MGKLHVGISFFMVALALLVIASRSAAATELTVRLDPASLEANVGDQFTLDLKVDNVTALNSVDIRLTYPAGALEVQDMDPLAFGTQIMPGPFLQPDQVCANSADNGVIRYCVGQLPPHTPATGSGVIAKITFRAILTGTHTIAFDRAQSFLYQENDPTPLPVTQWGDATVVIPKRPMVLTGTVKRQGWSGHDGSVVWTLFRADPNQFVMPNPVCTDQSGAFRVEIRGGFISSSVGASPLSSRASIFPPPNCPPTSLPYRAVFVQASFQSYLLAEKWICLNDQTTNMEPVTLLGGDVNEDNSINILDIIKVIGDMGKSISPCTIPVPECPGSRQPAAVSDINGDCRVDIGDLSIATGNFDKSSPTPWVP